MEKLNTKDIQGLLLRSYKDLPFSYFVFCGAQEINKYKLFLGSILPEIINAEKNPTEQAINIAFTNRGVDILQKNVNNFSAEFVEGMNSDFRQRILGDYGDSDRNNWHWGNESTSSIHFVLMLYSNSQVGISRMETNIKTKLSANSIKILYAIVSEDLPGDKEHFGFHDGISQPVLKSIKHKKKAAESSVVADGEFIFGYLNEYNKKPISPTAPDFNFGENGSYMVFRQIKQKVKEFWEYANKQSQGNVQGAIFTASKMMGRYPDGTPLVLSPMGPDPTLSDANDFSYYKSDRNGYNCPIGAHIRKANPRDGINGDQDGSIAVANHHRILRRGRPYGSPLVSSMKPEDILKTPDSGDERGLLFICFNTNISRQFEFVQQQWMNNKKFDHLYNDPDPIVGVDEKPPFRGITKQKQLGEFTIQACPVRKKLQDVPQFTEVRGGAYFFLPGIEAIKFLSK